MFNFSTCLLEGIMDSVRNAIPIQRAMFPREWMAPLKAPHALYGRPPPGPPPTWEPAPALLPPPPGRPPPTRPGQEDTRHPKIKLLIDPYLKRYNNYMNIPEILTPHPSKILPPNCPILLVLELRVGKMLPRTSVQVCPGPFKKGESRDSFADSVTDVISKGVLHYINLPVGEGGDGSPKNKRKGRGVGTPADT